MRTIRRLFYADILSSVAFVALAFLSLFFFIDFVEELGAVGRGGYTTLHAVAYSLLELPGHLYELCPIAILIGTIYTLSRMAQSSEFTILRTGGLGPGRALGMLASLGAVFAVLTFAVGDYVAPYSEQKANQLRAYFKGGSTRLETASAWLKDRRADRSSSIIQIGSLAPNGTLQDVNIFEFDADSRLLRRLSAKEVEVNDQLWQLNDVTITHWLEQAAPTERLATHAWSSSLSAGVVAAAVMPLETTSTLELLRYVNHLSNNEQTAQRHAIQFWKRAFYPLACLVMMGLALPFAYLQSRSGSVSLKVFGGIMLGISFVLLNNVVGHVGLLKNWTPWLVAVSPSALYLFMSMTAFAFLVRYR
ncbi:MAG: LPS export ABC transporter permease LptG [Pseudomonadota bacterium]